MTSDPVTGGGTPDLRFFLPPGPPLEPRGWQRRWRVGIRVGSVLMAVAFVVIAGVAVVHGVHAMTHFTASASVEVRCEGEAVRPSFVVGAPVTIRDADTSEVYGTSRLTKQKTLSGGICLLGFIIDEVPVADLYLVEIGATYRRLASDSVLRNSMIIA